MTEVLPVTVVIPVKNEAAQIEACLSRLGRFAAVVVVDSASTDGTAEMARAGGATVLDFAWDGRYPKKRNWVLLHHRFSTPWVLFLDADEWVTEAFCREAATAIARGTNDGFWLNYTTYFQGRRLRFGLEQRKLALFRVGAGLYERVDEDAWSALDMEVHEHPVLAGPVGEIRSPIDHRDAAGIEKQLRRHIDYARWEARRTSALAGKDLAHFTSRQRLKYRHLHKWWFPWAYFAHAYFLRRGFLDGAAGFHYALLKAWYFVSVRLMLIEAARGDGQGHR